MKTVGKKLTKGTGAKKERKKKNGENIENVKAK